MRAYQLYSQEGIVLNKETIEYQNISGSLAWAAKHNISFEDALKSLVSSSAPFFFSMILYVINPFMWRTVNRRRTAGYRRWRISGVKPFFRSAVESAVTELQEGVSLSQALHMHLRWWLPEFYIEAVKLSEEKGCESQTLIQLAETTGRVRRRRKEVISVLIYPIIILFFAFYILWGLMIFILPKFKKIFDDLLEGQSLPDLTEKVIDFAHMLIPESPVTMIFIIQIPWVIYYLFCTHRADWILVKIPFFKKAVLRWKMIDAIQALSVYSKMNIPLDEALSLICDQQPRSSFKNKLLNVRDDVVNGVDFYQSWVKHFAKHKLSHFYISNGLSTDSLPESLDTLANVLQDEDNRKHALTLKISEPLTIIMLSLIIGIIVIAMFLPMIYLVKMMSSMAF